MLHQRPGNERFVAIVDAFSTGRYLAGEIMTRGYKCLHVHSGAKTPPDHLKTFNTSDFVLEIKHVDHFDQTVATLKKFDVACILPGAESGVELADRLSEHFNLTTNGSRLSKARRDKFLMMEALRACGLQTPKYYKADKVDAILDWVRESELTAVVLKPLSSASTDNVHICESEWEIRQAFSSIIGHENRYGAVNHEVLVEEYLYGIEYVVNTVSRDNQHYFGEIWRCKKQVVQGTAAAACIYDLAELLPASGEIQTRLTDYTGQVLDALTIANGPAHAEIMMTSNGPVLIEIGARLMGSINPAALDECLGTNPVRLTVAAYLTPSVFKQSCQHPYSLRKHAYGVCLISRVQGTLVDIPLLREIEQLESFFSVRLSVQVGNRIKRTVNFFTSPGGVYLIHSDPVVLENDYRKLRQLEATGYVVR